MSRNQGANATQSDFENQRVKHELRFTTTSHHSYLKILSQSHTTFTEIANDLSSHTVTSCGYGLQNLDFWRSH
jgi:hypothetical protein